MKQASTAVNVMLDLETLGTRPGCVILSIGATTFGADSTPSVFYERIARSSYAPTQFHEDNDTLAWWSKQNEDTRKEAFSGTQSVTEALSHFSSWLSDLGKTPIIWGNGSDFDNAILAEVYRRIGMKAPWSFYNNRCYRTLKNLYPEFPFTKPVMAHNALQDAKAQAIHAEKIFEVML